VEPSLTLCGEGHRSPLIPGFETLLIDSRSDVQRHLSEEDAKRWIFGVDNALQGRSEADRFRQPNR
jgi:hypothetical protein